MATVIDALLVTLGLDATGFTKGADAATKAQKKLTDGAASGAKSIEQVEKKLSDAQAARAKEMEARAKAVAQGFHTIRNEALGFLAILAGAAGLKQFVANTIGTAAGLDRMSANLNMSAKDLSMWQLANKHAGGTAEGMTEQLKDASTELARFQNGSSEKMTSLLKWGAMFGVDIDISKLKTGTDVLMARADVLAAISKKDPGKTMLAASEMGVSEDALPLMKQGAEAVERMRQEQSRLADEMAAASKPAEELRKKMDALGNSFNSSAVKIVTAFTPAMTFAIGLLEKFANLIADQETQEFIGGTVAKILAFFGNEEAKEAVRINEAGKKPGVKSLFGIKFGNREDWIAEKEKNKSGAPTAGATPAGAAPTAPARSGETRGMRNNNPGNIEWKQGGFAQKHGATGSDGRFAIFPTMEAGQAAQRALLGGYLSSGANTVSKAINKWAPSSENNTAAYVAAVAKQMGIGPDQTLNSSHIPALADAISRHENGAAWDKRNAMAAVNLAANAGRGNFAGAGGSTNTSTTEVKIAQINVQTQATDAVGIAKDLRGAITSNGLISQANTGFN